MTEAVADYDAVAYPSGVFSRTHPDRMAVVARLHGLSPPPIETARVLEIGGGDGMNLLGLAVAFPQARFVDFDLSEAAVGRGRAIAAAAGLDNIRIERIDLLEAAETLDGPFDYILAHGVYAWVPPVVRAAVMPLIGRVLAPDGVAFVSYNALPGGYLRLALRAMMLDEVGTEGPVLERMRAALAVLERYGEPREDDPPLVAALRAEARSIAERDPAVLCHDELNPDYHPQLIRDVVADATANGLGYLGEADAALVEHGFLPDEAEDHSDEMTVRVLQADDFARGRHFRNSLFVRAGAMLSRRLESAPLETLHVAIPGRRTGPLGFAVGGAEFDVPDAGLADRIEVAMRVFPRRLPVRTNFPGKRDRDALFQLFVAGFAELSTVAGCFVDDPGERPVASPLARVLAKTGATHNITLDQRFIEFTQPGAREFLQLLDGTRDRATLARDWATYPESAAMSADAALRALANTALLMP